jgi:hypothetical protein
MRNRRMSGKICIFLSIAALLLIQLSFLPSNAYSIVIKPGNLDHLALEVPSTSVAGESFSVGIKVFDANNNLITNYDQTGRDIQVSVSGAAKAVPSVLKASVFSAGSSNVRIEDTKAEEIRLILYDADIQNPLTAVSIRISPNALDHFALEAPGTARAGERFKVQVRAEDRFGNTVTDAEKSDTLKVRLVGSAQIKGVTLPDFVGGTSTITAMSEKIGTMYVEVISPDSAVKGRSGDIEITPADPDHFNVSTPEDATADETFRVKIDAYDRFENLIKDYDRTGKDVYLSSSGTGKLTPEAVAAKEFVNGTATMDVHYDKAESISISASLAATTLAQRKAAPRKPAQKETKAQVKEKPAMQRQEPPPALKPERKTAKRVSPREVVKEQQIFGVQDVKIIEAGPRALVVIKVPGITKALKYDKSLESIRGRDWIKLSLTPAENDIAKELAFESNLIGTIHVKDNHQGMVTDILIELLPNRVQYSIKRDEDALVIDVLRLGVAR